MGVAVSKKKVSDKEIESKVNAAMALQLAKQVAELDARIQSLNANREQLILQVGEAVCPFKPGQILVTHTGLGQNGLLVKAYVVPGTNPGSGFTPNNRWAIHTLSYAKDGKTLTNRFLVITEERMREGAWGEIKVKSNA